MSNYSDLGKSTQINSSFSSEQNSQTHPILTSLIVVVDGLIVAVLIDPRIDVAVRMEPSRVIDHVIHVVSGRGRTENWHRGVQLKKRLFFQQKKIIEKHVRVIE